MNWTEQFVNFSSKHIVFSGSVHSTRTETNWPEQVDPFPVTRRIHWSHASASQFCILLMINRLLQQNWDCECTVSSSHMYSNAAVYNGVCKLETVCVVNKPSGMLFRSFSDNRFWHVMYILQYCCKCSSVLSLQSHANESCKACVITFENFFCVVTILGWCGLWDSESISDWFRFDFYS